MVSEVGFEPTLPFGDQNLSHLSGLLQSLWGDDHHVENLFTHEQWFGRHIVHGIMVYHTSRYINTIVSACQVLVQRKDLLLVNICETHGSWYHWFVVFFMATTKCAVVATCKVLTCH